MRHDLGFFATTLACISVVAVLLWPHPTKAQKVQRVLCYVQTEHPVSVVCPEGKAYWHPMGRATPIPLVPK